MKRLAPLLLLSPALLFAACDRGPDGANPSTFDRMMGATPTPTPTPPPVTTPKPKSGDWMFDKKRGNPLEQKAKKTN